MVFFFIIKRMIILKYLLHKDLILVAYPYPPRDKMIVMFCQGLILIRLARHHQLNLIKLNSSIITPRTG